MAKVNLRVEKIFAHAAALQQSGRLRNTVYGIGKFIFIMNQDYTILMEFPLRTGEASFKEPISFNANDYDSNNFKEKHGKICFIQEDGDYIREKSCKSPEYSPKKVHKLFMTLLSTVKKRNKVVISKNFTSLLDESLSHIEFSAKDGKLITVQRNIYSGSVITIKRKTSKGLMKTSKLNKFKPKGVRTNDLLALFTFVDNIAFYFNKNVIAFESMDKGMPFSGVISQCVYDELGGV